MSIITHNHRLQARWPAAATALSCTRGVGRFAASSKCMGGIDGVSEPGRARQWRDDT